MVVNTSTLTFLEFLGILNYFSYKKFIRWTLLQVQVNFNIRLVFWNFKNLKIKLNFLNFKWIISGNFIHSLDFYLTWPTFYLDILLLNFKLLSFELLNLDFQLLNLDLDLLDLEILNLDLRYLNIELLNFELLHLGLLNLKFQLLNLEKLNFPDFELLNLNLDLLNFKLRLPLTYLTHLYLT